MSYIVCVIRTAHGGVHRRFSGRLWPVDGCMGGFSVAAAHHYSNCLDHNLGHTCPGVAMCLMMASKCSPDLHIGGGLGDMAMRKKKKSPIYFLET